ncbi:uncharacterized protein LOC144331131 isoform X2 [Macaca mulatta]
MRPQTNSPGVVPLFEIQQPSPSSAEVVRRQDPAAAPGAVRRACARSAARCQLQPAPERPRGPTAPRSCRQSCSSSPRAALQHRHICWMLGVSMCKKMEKRSEGI